MRSPYDRNLLSDSLRPDIANSFPAYSECQHSSASSHEHKPCSLDRLSEAFGDGCDVYGGEGGNLCLEVAECLHCEVGCGLFGEWILRERCVRSQTDTEAPRRVEVDGIKSSAQQPTRVHLHGTISFYHLYNSPRHI